MFFCIVQLLFKIRPFSSLPLIQEGLLSVTIESMCMKYYRPRAKKGPAHPPPPLGNFADISYLEENFKSHLLRDVCTLCSGALVSDSLLICYCNKLRKKSKCKIELQKEDIKPSYYSNFLCSLQAGFLSYIKAAFSTKLVPSMVLYALYRLSFL